MLQGALILAALATSGLSALADIKVTTAAEHTRVLFSANDALCKPLARLYDQFSQHRYYADFSEERLQVRLTWEDEYPDRFRAIGLERVAPLTDTTHPRSPDHVVEPSLEDAFREVVPPLSAYYKVDLASDGLDRIVYIADRSFSRHDYSSKIWILKPGADVQPADDQFPDFVEFGISFNGDLPDEYPHIENPYLFDKIASNAEKARPARVRAAREATISGGAVIQRLFKFQDRYVFTARALGLGYALVYRYEGGSIDDLCYLVPQATIQYLKHNSAHRP